MKVFELQPCSRRRSVVVIHVWSRHARANRFSAQRPGPASAWVRALGGGSGRKTDDTDAHAVAVAGLRGKDLELVQPDDHVIVLKLMADRRQQLVEQRRHGRCGHNSSP
ncbi:MAG: hypothetical protein ACJ74O_06545 [Frankiaceae bacterium]